MDTSILNMIDFQSLPSDVCKLLEDTMKQSKVDKVKKIHRNSICQGKDGRFSTKFGVGRQNRKTIKASSEEELYEKLYHLYFEETEQEASLGEVFESFYEYYLKNNKVDEKTLVDYKFEYNKFFKNDEFSKLKISKITTREMSQFLDRAHQNLSKLDVMRGKTKIEQHRHNGIRTVINHIYKYYNTYMGGSLRNPIDDLDYSSWKYYRSSDEEHDWYDEKDRIKLSNLFANMENPTLEECCAAFVLETAARNSEARAIRFSDFHFESETPYVRICGMAKGSHRDERVKADSWTGKRNCPMTNNLIKIYEVAKKLSWSDIYPFVRDPSKVIEQEILITSQGLQRGLISLCEKANVSYLPPHQIRNSDATIMAIQGMTSLAIKGRLGHTTTAMAEKYIRNVNKNTIHCGPTLYPPVPTESTQ